MQRWEQLGLPVHRPKGCPRGAVSALAEELEEWLAAMPTHQSRILELEACLLELQTENQLLKRQLDGGTTVERNLPLAS